MKDTVVFFDTEKQGVELQKLALYIGWRWNNHETNNGIYIIKSIYTKAIKFSTNTLSMFYSMDGYKQRDYNYKGINGEIVKALYIPIRKKGLKSELIIKRRKDIKLLKNDLK